MALFQNKGASFPGNDSWPLYADMYMFHGSSFLTLLWTGEHFVLVWCLGSIPLLKIIEAVKLVK